MEWTDIRRTHDFAEKENLKRKTKWFSEKQKKKTNQLNLSVESHRQVKKMLDGKTE